MTAVPERWTAAALAPPFAHGGPPVRATLKASAEDFIVDERLGFVADGGVAHVLLKVEKHGRDTLAVTRELGRYGGFAGRDVGFAGLKDRVAIATQWFTVPANRPAADWVGAEGPGFRVLEAGAHSRKLRRGALTGNGFRLVLRDVSGDRDALARRLQTVAHVGVPNYFGIQRFGREGSNLVSAARFAAGEGLPRGREPRAFVLSAARSLMFNAVLARRVAQGSWNGLLPGELVNLAGRGSWFASEAIDEVLLERLARYDIHGTGPLPGRGVVPVGEAGALEADVLAEFAPLIAALESEGVESARRPLRLVPGEFDSTLEGDTLSLSFTLPSGAYATALVRELVASDDLPQESTDD